MKIRNMFKKFIYSKDTELDARFHEEMVAMLALKYTKKFDTNLQAKQLDEFYDTNSRLDAAVEKEVQTVLSIMAKMAADVPTEFKNKKKLSKGLFHVVADAIQIALAEGYSIKKPKEFLAWVLARDAAAVQAAKKLTEEQKEQSYTEWLRLYYVKKNYLKSRQLLADQLATSAVDLGSAGVLLKKRTHKDCFNQKDIALHLWIDQGHCDRNGAEIDILDIYLGKTHVDHVRSVRDGGTTTYDNAELTMASDNLAKGAASYEAAFPHQAGFFAFPEDAEDDG